MDKNNKEKSCLSAPISCLITIYLRTFANPYFISDYNKFDNACFI